MQMLDERLERDLRALCVLTELQVPSLVETERRLRERVRGRRVARQRVTVAAALFAACGSAFAAPALLEWSSAERAEVAPQGLKSPLPSVHDADRRFVIADVPARAKQARARRDALQRDIVRNVATTRAQEPGARASNSVAAEPSEPEAPGLENKLGPGREALVQFLNQEFSPMLAECFEQAQARSPQLRGMYRLSLTTLADEELGAVIDAAEPSPTSEITDPVFFECLRESAFTLVIPPPLTSGLEKFELNGYFGEEPRHQEDP